MKKLFLIYGVLVASLFSCKKDNLSYPDKPAHLNFYNVSKTVVTFIDGKDADQTVTFDVFSSKVATQDIVVSIDLDAATTAADSVYQMSATQVTIPAGSYKASGEIEFFYDGFELDESKVLVLDISSEQVDTGFNNQLVINVGKFENPLKTTFPGDYTVYEWDDEANVGDKDAAWVYGITLTFNDTDPEAASMWIEGLWDGTELVKIIFDFDNNTVTLPAQMIDLGGWDVDYPGPWNIEEVEGTFDPTTRILEFTYIPLDETSGDPLPSWAKSIVSIEPD